MFDPTVGRWISEDPLGFDAGDANLYRHVHNDPLVHVDPSGLQGAGVFPNDWTRRMYLDGNSDQYRRGANSAIGDSYLGVLALVSGSYLYAQGPAIAAGARMLHWRVMTAANEAALGTALTAQRVQDLIRSSGDRVVTVFTRLTQQPRAQELHTALNVGLCRALPNGQANMVFSARVPADLWNRLIFDQLIRRELIVMGNVTDHAYVISADAMRLLLPFFERVQ